MLESDPVLSLTILRKKISFGSVEEVAETDGLSDRISIGGVSSTLGPRRSSAEVFLGDPRLGVETLPRPRPLDTPRIVD